MDVRITLAFSNEMRITSSSRDHTTNLAKCTKMTEGEHRIHGMNGVSDSGNGNAALKQEKIDSGSATTTATAIATATATPDTYSNLGGRLKFFKNGRFILELARAREGEKVAWVPVPKKTFWPPPGSTSSLSTYRQESSTSLSVSDDNSSIQSSPWQRDHTWKQTSPQRNNSSNLNFYLMKKGYSSSKGARKTCWQYKLQRAPYLVISEQQRTKCSILNKSNNKCNNSKCINNNNRSSAIGRKKQTLVQVVEFLWNKTLQTFNSITSPRKRILRELERVTIDDDLSIYNKRCRGKKMQQPSIVNKTTNNNDNCNSNVSNVVQQNGCDGGGGGGDQRSSSTTPQIVQQQQQQPSNKNCSYSITSLLGDKNDENKSSSSSSHSRTDNIITSSPSPSIANHAAYISTDLSNNKNTIETLLVKNNKRSPIPRGRSPDSSPSPSHYNYHLSHPGPHFMSPYSIYSSVLHQHQHPVAMPSYINPYYHQQQQQQQHQHHQQQQGPTIYAAATRPSVFYQAPVHQHQPIGPRHETQYSSPTWNSYEQHHLQTLHNRDDSDVPLNLSKHAD